MITLISIGVVTTISIVYLANKSWHALHKMVGITPGVLMYKDPSAPIALMDMRWQRLKLNSQHLKCLPETQLFQLQNIDRKVAKFYHYQQSLQQQNVTSAVTEQQFVLQKLLQQRLPEMLASHHYLTESHGDFDNIAQNGKHDEARQLLQVLLDNINNRLDGLLAKMEAQHLQDMRVMKRYLDTHITD